MPPKGRSRIILIAVIGFIASVIGYFILSGKNKVGTVHDDDNPKSIAVLPFVNMSEPGQEYFSDGLSEGILNSLAQLNGLKVTSRTSSFQFRGKEVDIKEVSKKLGVGTVLEGSVQRQGDRIRITVQLINAEGDYHVWSEQYDERVDDIFALHDKIAEDIAGKLQITLLENERHTKKPTANPEAYNLYLKGRQSWNLRTPPALKEGIDYFQQAIALDPQYAAAYSGLADCYTALGYGSHLSPKEAFPKAFEAATKALQLNPTLADPHATLGYYRFYYDWDWAAAEQEFRSAIALNPNYELGYDWYGYYLTAMERYEEASVILKKAKELDPLSVAISTDMGFSLYYSREYDQAIKALNASLEMNPKFGLAHLWTGRAYQEKKMYKEAVEEYGKTLLVAPGWPVALGAVGNVYGIMGERLKAKKILDTLVVISKDRFVTSYGVALVYAGLGDQNKAFEWINKAYDERSNWLVWLKSDPRWSSIRSDKRFLELVHRVGLPD